MCLRCSISRFDGGNGEEIPAEVQEGEGRDGLLGRASSSLSFVVQKCLFHHPEILQDSKNYGGLNEVVCIQEAVLVKQMESLQTILLSMKNTMQEFHCIVLSLGRIHRDGRQMIKGGSSHLSSKQLQQQVGVKPTLAVCLDGLMHLQDMHCSEYIFYVLTFFIVNLPKKKL